MRPHQSLLERSTLTSTHPKWSARKPSWSSTRFPLQRNLGPTVDQQDRGHHICSTSEDLLPHPWGGIGQINSDQAMARRCTAQWLQKSKQL
ncbi:unnamed protein product [Prunus armeniaca]